MNKSQIKLECERVRKNYTIPSGASYQQRPKNAIYISSANTIRHEISKCLGAYMLKKWGDIKFNDLIVKKLNELEVVTKQCMAGFVKENCDFITEACPKDDKDRRVDLVRLKDDQRFEFETQKAIKKENACSIYI